MFKNTIVIPLSHFKKLMIILKYHQISSLCSDFSDSLMNVFLIYFFLVFLIVQIKIQLRWIYLNCLLFYNIFFHFSPPPISLLKVLFVVEFLIFCFFLITSPWCYPTYLSLFYVFLNYWYMALGWFFIVMLVVIDDNCLEV